MVSELRKFESYTIMAMDTMRPNPDNLNQMMEPFVCTLDRSRTPSQLQSKEIRTVRIQKPFSRLTPISNGNTTTTTTTTNTTTATVAINGHQMTNKAFEPRPPGTKQRRPRSRNIAIPTSPPMQTKKLGNSISKNPSRVGKYSVLRTLGRGNFAQVKLAVHMTTGREVAIKMIDKTTLNENCRIKLSREIRVLKSLIHPNIVRLYEVIETTRNVYLVMEYAKNGEVFDHLMKHGRMDEKQARSIFRQLFSAVEYCHQKNIVHRDLKAENLLLDGQNNLKLADFGFANQFDSGCTLDTFCGSPPYAAPELLSGKKYHGPEVDVWALGVILYMLVCGKLPFEAYTLKELHTRVLSGKYQIPFYMSGACESMLKQMLVIDPKKRSTLKELMQQSWINIGYEREPLQPFVETGVDYNDPIRRALMSQLGFNPDDLRDAFENGCFDNVTATYLLLADTETRHKVTNRLQNQMHANSTILTDPEGTDYLGDDNDDDETKHERSSSAFSRAGQTADVQSRARGNWVTGSLRNHNWAQDNDKYMRQTKQFCRPSLNLPKLIAYADGNNKTTDDEKSPTKGTEDLTYNRGDDDTSTADHTEESSMAVPKANNGLRRIRTSTLDMEDSESEDHSFRAYDLRKKPLIIEHKTRTDPLTRRTLQPGTTKMPFPRTRTRSIVIVSDMRDKPNANRQVLCFPVLLLTPYACKIIFSVVSYF
ncbi:hypothetical protein EG68_02752 [Paragonimus skrjabini miyazakii]|uniref:non-specific serine/threonine protein kinase n=1 Tax=Paragonimus skrjabini miyazakii TaxID=59628 RepID=A0A8S9Z3Q6_9TREM|nr:hypothetical protein EG68_02752 [Paragonimus skrjabini miyazakii]